MTDKANLLTCLHGNSVSQAAPEENVLDDISTQDLSRRVSAHSDLGIV